MKQQITPTEHEKREWARLAQAAYKVSRNDIGHEFSGAASLMRNQQMDVERFDFLQAGYRGWLNNNILPAQTHRRATVKAFVDAETAGVEVGDLADSNAIENLVDQLADAAQRAAERRSADV